MIERNPGRIARLGLIQVDNILTEQPEAKYARLLELGEACLRAGADLIFFPESFQYTGVPGITRNPARLRELGCRWQQRCAELARRYHAYVVPWDYEAAEDGRVYNTSYILDRDGREAGRYRKCHLTYSESERKGISRGEDLPVFSLDIGRVGILICFDNYFPESARVLGKRGAELVLYPLYGDTLNPQWELKLRARVADGMFYMAPCQIDMDAMRSGTAFTGLVDPEGSVTARLTQAGKWRVEELRMGRPVLTHTMGPDSPEEDLRLYLERTANPAVCAPLAERDGPMPDWDEVWDPEERRRFYGE